MPVCAFVFIEKIIKQQNKNDLNRRILLDII
jgi:hypothetical protein